MKNWNLTTKLPLAGVLTAFLGLLGCSSHPPDLGIMPGQLSPAPPPPAFLTSPMSLLLTNANFSARASTQSGTGTNQVEIAAGELLGRSGSLLFAPGFAEPGEKPMRQAGISFLWDTRSATGYILSEGLQAYAPVPVKGQFVQLSTTPGGRPNERLDGHDCAYSQVRMRYSDGTEAVFDVWSAPDLNNLPLRIVRNGSPSLSLTLTRARLEEAPAELFRPPDEFTRYGSPESLMTELSIRQHNLRRH